MSVVCVCLWKVSKLAAAFSAQRYVKVNSDECKDIYSCCAAKKVVSQGSMHHGFAFRTSEHATT